MFSFLPALPKGFPPLPHCTWEIRTYLIFLAADSPTTFPVSPVVASLEAWQEVEAGISPLYLPSLWFLSDIGMSWRDYSSSNSKNTLQSLSVDFVASLLYPGPRQRPS